MAWQVWNGDKMIEEFASHISPSRIGESVVMQEDGGNFRIVAYFNSRGGWTHLLEV